MNIIILPFLILFLNLILIPKQYSFPDFKKENFNNSKNKVKLPLPHFKSQTSIEEALKERRSIRSFSKDALTIEELSQLLWSAQGITGSDGKRTSSSAGALFPIEIYIAVGKVKGISQGIYKYIPIEHSIIRISGNDVRAKLSGQSWIKTGAIVIAVAAVYERTKIKYGNRANRYVHIEAGSVAQNIYLQAVSLNLGTTCVGAFNDSHIKAVLKMSKNEQPLVLMPIGKMNI